MHDRARTVRTRRRWAAAASSEPARGRRHAVGPLPVGVSPCAAPASTRTGASNVTVASEPSGWAPCGRAGDGRRGGALRIGLRRPGRIRRRGPAGGTSAPSAPKKLSAVPDAAADVAAAASAAVPTCAEPERALGHDRFGRPVAGRAADDLRPGRPGSAPPSRGAAAPAEAAVTCRRLADRGHRRGRAATRRTDRPGAAMPAPTGRPGGGGVGTSSLVRLSRGSTTLPSMLVVTRRSWSDGVEHLGVGGAPHLDDHDRGVGEAGQALRVGRVGRRRCLDHDVLGLRPQLGEDVAQRLRLQEAGRARGAAGRDHAQPRVARCALGRGVQRHLAGEHVGQAGRGGDAEHAGGRTRPRRSSPAGARRPARPRCRPGPARRRGSPRPASTRCPCSRR